MIAQGTSLSHYKIVRPLGSGGMADVYEAEDEKLGRRVALKVLPPELGRNPDYVKRFEKEVRAAASLSHPGIVTVFEVGQTEAYLFYSMRLLPGGDLADRIRDGVTAGQSLALVRELADAFDHAHNRGLVHRDVKPANILFDERGRAVLTDFGIVKALAAESHLTATGTTIGTPRYMSPEQARGLAVDGRADLYSLGVILHEMLTGRAPYESTEAIGVILMHMTEPIPRLPAEHAVLQPLLDSLMAKNPADRPASAAALMAMVDVLSVPAAPTVRPEPEHDVATVAASVQMAALASAATLIAPIAIRRTWRRSALVGTGLLAVAVLVLAVGWSINTSTLPTAPPSPDGRAMALEAPLSIPEPIMEAAAPSPEAPAAESVAVAAPPPAVAAPAMEIEPSPRRERRDDRVATTRASATPPGDDPECEELHMLFGLGQSLSAEQQEYLTKNCG